MRGTLSPVANLRTAETRDAALLERMAAGDLSSLGVLFGRYVDDVRSFVARLGVDAGDIDDLAQSTFLTAMSAAASFHGGGSARAWLLGIAVNLVRRRRRSLARLAARVAAWAQESHEDAALTPEDATDLSERSRRAARALMRLSDRKRDVFVMVVMEGMSAEEVASSLGIPIGTVWTRLHHARRDLRARLEQEGVT
jgi:RNA polymerase sigma factor (sigma-70 family)